MTTPSREDAIAQASARFMAASRALKFLEADIEDNREHPGMSAARSTARAARGTTPSDGAGVGRADATRRGRPSRLRRRVRRARHRRRASAKRLRPDRAMGSVSRPVRSRGAPTRGHRCPRPRSSSHSPRPPRRTGAAEPAPTAARPAAPVGRTATGPEDLLIELRTSPLGADIDHIGDRLLVFVDRVELRDRNDRVRQVLSGEDITDVVVQRKFTGAVLAVESGSGESIVTRGLKPEQADQARLLIHKRTRAGRPVCPR